LNIKNINYKEWRKFPKWLWRKIKALVVGIQQKYREKFPRKQPKLYDADIHEMKYILKLAILAFFMYLYIETFARATDGIFNGVMMIWKQPLIFVYNWLIIFATLTISLLFRKRGFATMIIMTVWGILGTANGCILIKRMTPFTLYDLQNLGDGMTLLTTYFSKLQIILGGLAIGIGIAFLVLYFISCYRWENIDWKKSGISIVLAFVCTGGATFGLLQAKQLSTFFGNLNYAYEDYGFPYCFINTSINTGISKPVGYSESAIKKILKKTKNKTNTTPKKQDVDEEHPNIIVLQMESFTYAQDYHNIKVSNDPTPNFTKLMKNYTTGWFEVPACGAGTANTEFEVLTGISAKFFGPGEYPYKGKLRKKTLESMAYILKNNGYSTYAMHNHRALFYNRNEVYKNLGFDSFTSLEYMNNITLTPTGWAQDKVMTDDIIDILKNSKNRSFMHIVSVQGHGSYPTTQVFKNPYTTVTASNEETKWKYEYYINEMHQMDTFLGDLLSKIKESGEPTIVLIYGDHIPALDVKSSDYANGDLYKTRYVIWDNIGLSKKDKNISSYQAGAELLEDAGLSHQGVIFDYQQSNSSKSKSYLKDQKELAYDMLYGNNYTFGGTTPYKSTKMKMGYKEITIDKIVKIGDNYYIKGKNFTERSKITMDGKTLSTIYLSSTLLGLQDEIDPSDVDKLEVSQTDKKDDTILSTVTSQEEL
jgi:phosphoglycerol transferase MdoB-like AlkP superfamily enzyme